jgi:hypothetical protein
VTNIRRFAVGLARGPATGCYLFVGSGCSSVVAMVVLVDQVWGYVISPVRAAANGESPSKACATWKLWQLHREKDKSGACMAKQ